MFFESELFKWVLLPLLIFIARIADVSIGTIRIVFVSRGQKFLAPLLGFVEILIWLLAIGQIMRNLSNVACYIAYSSGFAMGTYVGLYIEEKLALGLLTVRIITHRDASKLVSSLRKAGFGVTDIPAFGSTGKVDVIYTIVRRSDLEQVAEIISRYNPNAFYSIENVRAAKEGIFPGKTRGLPFLPFLGKWRKGK